METIVRNQHNIDLQMVHPEVYGRSEKYIYAYGGRGGGKSKTVARCVVLHCWENPGISFLVTRKTMPSLRITAMKDVMDVINELGIAGTPHVADHYFQFINGSIVYFLPLYVSEGRNERLKSLDLNGIWFEEATEATKKDFDSIHPAVRLQGLHKFYFTFNPPETSEHWIYKQFDRQKAKGTARKVHFDIEDNPLLPDDIKEELYDLKELDNGLYLRFAKGKWGINVRRQTVWERVERGTIENKKVNGWFCGLDFGWNHPLSFHLYGDVDNDVYMVEEIHKRHLHIEDLAPMVEEKFAKHGIDKANIIITADCEDPEKIAMLQDLGFYVKASKKGKGSKKAGIDKVRLHKIVIDEDMCPQGWKEINNYIFLEDKDGNIKEETIKLNDDSCDDLRYGVVGYYSGAMQFY